MYKVDEWLEENELLAVAIVFVTALGLRLVSLDAVFWQDEALYVLSSQNFSGLLGTYPAGFPVVAHPPLYTYILALVHLLPWESEAVFRLPGVFAGALTAPVIYALGRELYDRRTGIVSAVILAFSTNHLMYSQDVHPAAFAILFSSLAVFFSLQLFESKALFSAGTASLLAVLTHFVNYFLLAFLPVLYYLKNQRPETKEIALYGFLSVTTVTTFVYTLNKVFVPDIASSSVATGFQGAGAFLQLSGLVVSAPWLDALAASAGILDVYWGSAYLYLPLILLLVPLVEYRRDSTQIMYAWLLSVLAVVVPVTVLMSSAGYSPMRAYLLLIPPVVLLNARGIWMVFERWRPAILVGVVLLTALLFHLPQVYGDWESGGLKLEGGWYEEDGEMNWVFRDASIKMPENGTLRFEARSFEGDRTLNLSSGGQIYVYDLGENFSSHSLPVDAGMVEIDYSGKCEFPDGDPRCLAVGFRNIELVTGNADLSLRKQCWSCLRNPVGYDPRRDWSSAVPLLDETGEVYASYPGILAYYGVEESRLKSLRWNPGHAATNLEASLGEELWVVTDQSHYQWQFNALEREYLAHECDFSAVEKVWVFHCTG